MKTSFSHESTSCLFKCFFPIVRAHLLRWVSFSYLHRVVVMFWLSSMLECLRHIWETCLKPFRSLALCQGLPPWVWILALESSL